MHSLTEMPQAGHYGAIYADPPWNFVTRSAKGRDRCPDGQGHYQVMNLDAIKALPVVQLAAPDCVLLLWITDPLLERGFDVIRAWGFVYAAALTVLRASDAAGRPSQGRTPFGSFETWSSWVRDALVWFGEADSVSTVERVREGDPRLAALRAVLTLWELTIGMERVTTNQIIATIKNEPIGGVEITRGTLRSLVDRGLVVDPVLLFDRDAGKLTKHGRPWAQREWGGTAGV